MIPGIPQQSPQTFQSTPSVWRETTGISEHAIGKMHFNPLPPCGGRRSVLGAGVDKSISIHSLRVEGDPEICTMSFTLHHFNPLPPCGGRRDMLLTFLLRIVFQSTPSVWRETNGFIKLYRSMLFQSTPSVWRETVASLRGGTT